MLYSEEINTFLAVVRCGSLLQAAEVVCATQSTVSYRIQGLERRLGKTLIRRARGAKQISLTPDGEKFIEIAERWKELEREAIQMKLKTDRYLAIGTVDAVAVYLYPAFLESLCDLCPTYRIHAESGRFWTLHERVASGHLHVALSFTASNHVDLRSEAIASYAMHIVYNKDRSQPRQPVSHRDFDVTTEVYVPYSANNDIWREARNMSRETDSVDKVHLLAPLLKRPRRWALAPDFMTESLRAQTDCHVLRLMDDRPPDLVLYKVTRANPDDLTQQDLKNVDDALLRALAEQAGT